ncbi:type II toxin-antitoxin system YafQ family toxin [Peptoniphilus sp. GNH]|nr:type II toxin-antitoxin system YafQ family toxin [Peptoniphilus sp. GNH]
MRKIRLRKSFERDLKRIKKSGKYDLNRLFDVVEALACGLCLDTKFKDHKLKGEYQNMRECHIAPDWLLIYEISDDELVLVLNRTGSHAELF